MQAHPGIVHREVQDGMLIGSHTYTHPDISKLPPGLIDVQLNATQRLFGSCLRTARGRAGPETTSDVSRAAA